jgi:catechol 2,3-dioxygenase-like lactoylglutathione lyase family enzyme
MLKNAKVATRLPAKDLNRARAFYSEKLGLEPVEQREGGPLRLRGRRVCALCLGRSAIRHAHTNGLGSRGYRSDRTRASQAGNRI